MFIKPCSMTNSCPRLSFQKDDAAARCGFEQKNKCCRRLRCYTECIGFDILKPLVCPAKGFHILHMFLPAAPTRRPILVPVRPGLDMAAVMAEKSCKTRISTSAEGSYNNMAKYLSNTYRYLGLLLLLVRSRVWSPRVACLVRWRADWSSCLFGRPSLSSRSSKSISETRPVDAGGFLDLWLGLLRGFLSRQQAVDLDHHNVPCERRSASGRLAGRGHGVLG